MKPDAPEPDDKPVVVEASTSPAAVRAEKEAEAAFPIGVFLGWLIPGAALCVAAVLFGMKPLVPIVGGGGIVFATAMAVQLKFWELITALLGLSILAAIVFGIMWFRRSKMFTELVLKLEDARDSDEGFKKKMKKSVVLSPGTSAVVDAVKGKKK